MSARILIAVAMMATVTSAVTIQGVDVPGRYFFYRESDGLPLEVTMFSSPHWERILSNDAHPQTSVTTLWLAANDGREIRPSQYWAFSEAHTTITWSTCCDWEIPDSMSGGELDYRYTLDTYDIIRTGPLTSYEQSVSVALSHLSDATIRILGGGLLPLGTYTTGTLIAPIAGDLNGDNSVDAGDAAMMFVNWGNAGESDLNGDGITDAADAGAMFTAWTGDTVPSHATPEPGSGWLLVATVLAARRWSSAR